jgi:predicted DNA-binding transcriptional regulator YafY
MSVWLCYSHTEKWKPTMPRSDRLFELIQVLRRRKGAATAQWLAGQLEVTARTIYRDIAVLQSMRVPIEGEVGVGYIMRRGFDLPPLMFDAEEIEAMTVGLALLARTGDRDLVKAALRVASKIADVVPDDLAKQLSVQRSKVSTYGIRIPKDFDMAKLRKSIRENKKIRICYSNGHGIATQRTLMPIAVFYYVEVALLIAWCELRSSFRQFRIDRITAIEYLNASFANQAEKLRNDWLNSLQKS